MPTPINCYAGLDVLRRHLRVQKDFSSDTSDALMDLSTAVSRNVDEYTGAPFFSYRDTIRISGEDSSVLLMPSGMRLASEVFSVKVVSGNETISLVEGDDFQRVPRNGSIYGARALELLDDSNVLARWPSRQNSITIDGRWGRDYRWESGPVLDDSITDRVTTFVLTGYLNNITVGSTLLLGGEEEVAVVGWDSTTSRVTVIRAINGTSAEDGIAGTSVPTREYPSPVIMATAMEVSRLYRSGHTGFATTAGGVFTEEGTGFTFATTFPVIRQMLDRYRLPGIF